MPDHTDEHRAAVNQLFTSDEPMPLKVTFTAPTIDPTEHADDAAMRDYARRLFDPAND